MTKYLITVFLNSGSQCEKNLYCVHTRRNQENIKDYVHDMQDQGTVLSQDGKFAKNVTIQHLFINES